MVTGNIRLESWQKTMQNQKKGQRETRSKLSNHIVIGIYKNVNKCKQRKQKLGAKDPNREKFFSLPFQ